ncbi:MAG: FHA domain-containing protein [Pyrinomonadaceae bacterium]
MTERHDSNKTGAAADEPAKSDQTARTAQPAALPERLLRRALERAGEALDRKLGRTIDPKSGLTLTNLIKRMNLLIDQRVRDEGSKGRIAPHLLKLKVEWGKHSEADPELIQDLEHELLAAAIDHINDRRYRTLAPVTIETEVDIFTTGVSVDPSWGEFEEELKQEDEARRIAKEVGATRIPHGAPPIHDVTVSARITMQNNRREVALTFKPGGKRSNVGRGTDSELHLNDGSVSKIHATLMMNREEVLMVADTGSTNGTFINGRRISYGEACPIEPGDVVAFGDVEVRFRKDK